MRRSIESPTFCDHRLQPRLNKRASVNTPAFLLERTRGKPRHDLVLQRDEEQQYRQHEDRGESHDAVPVRVLGTDEAIDADGRWLQFLGAEQGQGIDELAIS